MKKVILASLAIVSIALAFFCMFTFSGTGLAYVGLFLMFLGVAFIGGLIESLPNYKDIEKRVVNFFEDEEVDYE